MKDKSIRIIAAALTATLVLSGYAANINVIDYVAMRFAAYSYVLVKGDEDNQIPIKDYLKMAES